MDFSQNPYYEKAFKFYDPSLLEKVHAEDENVSLFFRLLSLCHTGSITSRMMVKALVDVVVAVVFFFSDIRAALFLLVLLLLLMLLLLWFAYVVVVCMCGRCLAVCVRNCCLHVVVVVLFFFPRVCYHLDVGDFCCLRM